MATFDRRPTLLLALPGYEAFAKQMAAGWMLEWGILERRLFPDGERYLRIHGPVPNHNVILLGGTPDDASFLDLYDAACHVARVGARSLALVIPYYGYSTMERATQPGEVVTAKSRARAISAIPVTQTGNVAFLVDLHTDGIAHYFGDNLITHHLSAAPVIMDLIRGLGLEDPIIASTDAGRAKQVVNIANGMGLQAAFVYKRRIDDSLEMTGVNADVSGRPVVIYDDIVRTGGSLLQAAQAYLDQGATEVHAVATHLVLANDSAERLLQSGLLTSLSGTDTHPRCRLLSERAGRVASVVPVLREALLSRYPYLADA
jgi:ribose-phosphate pyrophosphokinase